ncbi:MAG: hypothetical protein QM346_18540 [Chloroflexota bacterium]|nr:hypothetical protein [Chloroflexota bacterium]
MTMKPYLVHEGKMWFVIAGCRIVAIVDTKAEGMERIRSLPPWSDRTSVSANGAAPEEDEA